MVVNKEAVKRIIEYMDKSPMYSFDTMLREFNLLDVVQDRGDDKAIPCPFHVDESPSFHFNDRKHVCHCFSCGVGGNALKFKMLYSNYLNGTNLSFYQTANDVLRSDPIMQADLGINTIYRNDVKDLPLTRRRIHLIKGDIPPANYLELVSKLDKCDLDAAHRKLAILLIQEGQEPSTIYKEVTGFTEVKEKDRKSVV